MGDIKGAMKGLPGGLLPKEPVGEGGSVESSSSSLARPWPLEPMGGLRSRELAAEFLFRGSADEFRLAPPPGSLLPVPWLLGACGGVVERKKSLTRRPVFLRARRNLALFFCCLLEMGKDYPRPPWSVKGVRSCRGSHTVSEDDD